MLMLFYRLFNSTLSSLTSTRTSIDLTTGKGFLESSRVETKRWYFGENNKKP